MAARQFFSYIKYVTSVFEFFPWGSWLNGFSQLGKKQGEEAPKKYDLVPEKRRMAKSGEIISSAVKLPFPL